MNKNFKSRELLIFATLTLLLLIYGPLFLPNYKLFFLAPLIIRLFYLKSYTYVLWSSCLLGLLTDLLSSHVLFGIHAFNYTITSFLLYNQKRNFFEDSFTTIPFLTFIYSICSTIVQILLLIVFENGVTFSWEFVKIDLLFLPFLDAVYALIFFEIPKMLFGKPQRKGKDYFLNPSD